MNFIKVWAKIFVVLAGLAGVLAGVAWLFESGYLFAAVLAELVLASFLIALLAVQNDP